MWFYPIEGPIAILRGYGTPLKINGIMRMLENKCLNGILSYRRKFSLGKKVSPISPPVLVGEIFYPQNFCPVLMIA